MKFCDLGHVIKPWAQHERWCTWVTEEFYLLGDSERRDGHSISALCNREKDTNVPKSQIGFFNFVCLPFFTAVARALPASETVGAHACQANFEHWQAKLAANRALRSLGSSPHVSPSGIRCPPHSASRSLDSSPHVSPSGARYRTDDADGATI